MFIEALLIRKFLSVEILTKITNNDNFKITRKIIELKDLFNMPLQTIQKIDWKEKR